MALPLEDRDLRCAGIEYETEIGETETWIMDLMRYSCLYQERLELAEVYQLFLYYYT